MMNAIALDVNHGFVFRFSESYSLASGDKYSLPTLAIAKNDKVFWQALANFV